jgi:hypothetical protein
LLGNILERELGANEVSLFVVYLTTLFSNSDHTALNERVIK